MKDLRQYHGRRVIVATEMQDFEGHVERSSSESLTLTGTHRLTDEGGRQPVDGELVIPVSRILYVQVPR